MSDETTDETGADTGAGATTDKHPPGLGMLFFSEMWERFSFYGMRGLLTLYLVNVVFHDIANKDEVAAHTYGAYGALVYATPFVGGLIADRLLGYKRSVMLGSVLMALGHIAMAVENEFFLYLALAFLIAGNGFFKPNISSMVGGLYKENDPRRDRGFTIFYMGINLGAFLQFIPAYLGDKVGWWAGFGLAGIGMLMGLVVFYKGQHVLGENGEPPDMERLKKKVLGPLSAEWLIYIGAFLSVGLFGVLVQAHSVMNYLLPAVAAVGFGMVLVSALRSEKVVRERLFAVLLLTFFNIIFWAFFEQAGSSMSLFTDRNVDRSIGDWLVPTAMFQSVNPFFILLLAPLFSLLWGFLGKRNAEPSIPVKFSLGLMQLGLGFLVMVWGVSLAYEGQIQVGVGDEAVMQAAVVVPLFVLLGAYFFHTTGELCLSPIGLSMVTKLVPKKMVAMVMGLWFLSTSLSHLVGGLIAGATGSSSADADAEAGAAAVEAGILESTAGLDTTMLESYDQLSRYAEVFYPIGLIAIGAGIALLLLTPILKKWQHGVT
ncbi:MAG: peptide MFS transporter [Sandaracinaceae bacterium]